MQQNQDPEVFSQPKVLPSAIPVRMPPPQIVCTCVEARAGTECPLYILNSQGLCLSQANLQSLPPCAWATIPIQMSSQDNIVQM
jgi:hypothetical protein